ncbi:MAG: conditioned medium-induced protein 4 [Halobacteria archaeon]
MTEENEKAEELRDLFLEVTDESTVTEEKEETRGTLKHEEEVEEEIGEVIEKVVDEYDVSTKLDRDQLILVVRGYYNDLSDTEIAEKIGDKKLNKTVKRARVKLHLFRDSDFDAPFEMDRLRELHENDVSTADAAEELDVSASTVRSYRNVVEAENQAKEADYSYRDEFEAVLEDRELQQHMTDSAKVDGLEDATEDMEVDLDM